MYEDFNRDFELLVKVSIDIGNRLTNVDIPDYNNSISFAEGLGQKIINHVLSANYLYSGYQLNLEGKLYTPKIDFASIAILARAALETYLTFNHIFISPKNVDDHIFRFSCWDLAGFIERVNFHASTEEHIKLKEFEKGEIEKLKIKINALELYQQLPANIQKIAMKGQWKLEKNWADLATNSGFSTSFFQPQYKFLCAYSHSSRLSVMQVQQNKNIEQQLEMASSLTTILMVVLAKFMFDYIELLPQLHEVKNEADIYQIILGWKDIAERL